MTDTDPLYVVAFNDLAFEKWCRAHKIDPQSKRAIFVNGTKTLFNLRQPIRFVFVDGWKDRKDAVQIYHRALVLCRRTPTPPAEGA